VIDFKVPVSVAFVMPAVLNDTVLLSWVLLALVPIVVVVRVADAPVLGVLFTLVIKSVVLEFEVLDADTVVFAFVRAPVCVPPVLDGVTVVFVVVLDTVCVALVVAVIFLKVLMLVIAWMCGELLMARLGKLVFALLVLVDVLMVGIVFDRVVPTAAVVELAVLGVAVRLPLVLVFLVILFMENAAVVVVAPLLENVLLVLTLVLVALKDGV